jgi:glycosyltransferase involved in cell wall biosynthesis
MYKKKRIAVVVPSYNEEKLIGRVIETMPDLVDIIVVVDDNSKDKTGEIVKSYLKKYGKRLQLISHEVNKGVGGAISTGYQWCRDNKIDITVVMAGDAQMDPDDMVGLIEPVANDDVAYAKGNRLISGEAWKKIPRVRYLGNSILSLLTKIASGYWHVADSQTGYTAISLKALQTISLEDIYPRYGMPNDMLVKLNVYNFRVRDVEIKPVYGVGEKSGFNAILIIPKMSWLMIKLFNWRMVQKYIIRDFHPLIFFYGFSFALLGILFPVLVVRFFYIWATVGHIPPINSLAIILVLITGIQFLLFGMWFDMDHNRDLK